MLPKGIMWASEPHKKRDLRRARKKRQHVHDTSEQRGTAELPDFLHLMKFPRFQSFHIVHDKQKHLKKYVNKLKRWEHLVKS